MYQSKKIIAFDLDGTLTESKQALTADVAEALVALSKIKKVAIISGGSFQQYKKQFLPYFMEFTNGADVSFENLILMPTSGTEVYEYDKIKKDWLLTGHEIFPEEIKKKVREVLARFVASNKYGIPAESWGERVEDRGNQITLSALGQQAPLENKKPWDPDQKKRQIMKAELEAEIPEVSVSIGGETSIDVLPKGFNKAVSLERLIKKLGYTISDLLYVGDALFPGGNDYAVIEDHIEAVEVSGPAETISEIKKMML